MGIPSSVNVGFEHSRSELIWLSVLGIWLFFLFGRLMFFHLNLFGFGAPNLGFTLFSDIFHQKQIPITLFFFERSLR
jgi:hypothetical protein